MADHGAVTWFQIGTDDEEASTKFYGELFGWTFHQHAGSGDTPYRLIQHKGRPQGGLTPDGDRHAVPFVQVNDVSETLRAAEDAGGKTLVDKRTTDDGLTFGHIVDPQGNRIGVFTPPAQG